jgi:hypothetical protein
MKTNNAGSHHAGAFTTAWVTTKLLPLLLLLILPGGALAQSYTNSYGIWGYMTTNATITITTYTGSGGFVVIPNTIDGLPVASVGYSAIAWCTNLTSMTIPDSVTSIGSEAFWGCATLASITIPNSVTNIGVGAFVNCASMKAISVDKRNHAYSSVDGVLFNNNQTTLVEYPGGLTGSYTISNSVSSVGDSAFMWCTNLTSATIPDSVTHIGNEAFGACLSLSNVYFQGNAPSFGLDVFGGPKPMWDPATIFYLPGTTGWDSVSAITLVPVVLWTPQVLASDSSFGVRTNQFGFNINWASGMSVAVDACTDLANPTWSPIITNTLTSGTAYFGDPEWSKYPTRFYRLRWP